jgi:hypothetical protein
MSNVTLSIPNEVYLKMKSHNEIRWSEVVRRALNEYIKKLEDKGMEVTTKDLIEELGDDFKKSLNDLKGYREITYLNYSPFGEME